MIRCPYCNSVFSSEGSYRVHKHRFHKGMEYRHPIVIQEVTSRPEPVEVKPDTTETITKPEIAAEESQQKPETGRSGRRVVERGKGGDNGLAILGGLGTIAVVIILALLGKK